MKIKILFWTVASLAVLALITKPIWTPLLEARLEKSQSCSSLKEKLPASKDYSLGELQEWMQRSNGVYSLLEAAEAGDLATLQARLKEGEESPNEVDEKGYSVLQHAVKGGNAALVKALLAAGADACVEDPAGRRASADAKGEIRDILLAAEQKRSEELRFVQSAEKGDAEDVRQALAAGANPNALAKDGESSVLWLAVKGQKEEIVRLLLEAGAKPNFCLPDKTSLLHMAAENSSPSIIRLLLAAGAVADAHKGNQASPLHDAVYAGRLEVLPALLPAYAAQNYSPSGGGFGSPVEMAIQRGRADIVKIFLEAGMDPNGPGFREPLLIQAARAGKAELLQVLLEGGSSREAKDAEGKTAADYAEGPAAELLKQNP